MEEKYYLNISGISDIEFRARNNITFKLTETKPNPFPNDVALTFRRVKKFLEENPKKSLEITGYYVAMNNIEKNLRNIGLRRAESIKKVLLSMGFLAQDITLSYKAVESLNGNDESNLVASKITIIDSPEFSEKTKELTPLAIPFSIQLGSELKIFDKDNFHFIRGDHDPMPLTDNFQGKLRKMVSYIQEKPTRKLIITGSYHPEEKNESLFTNIGIARANAIKNKLIELGLDSDKAILKDKNDPTLIIDRYNEYLSMVSLEIISIDEAPTNQEQDLVKQSNIIEQSVTIISSAEDLKKLKLTNEQKSIIVNFIEYTDKVKNTKILITGYKRFIDEGEKTTVTVEENDPAKIMANYLIDKGVRKSQIITKSNKLETPVTENNDSSLLEDMIIITLLTLQ